MRLSATNWLEPPFRREGSGLFHTRDHRGVSLPVSWGAAHCQPRRLISPAAPVSCAPASVAASPARASRPCRTAPARGSQCRGRRGSGTTGSCCYGGPRRGAGRSAGASPNQTRMAGGSGSMATAATGGRRFGRKVVDVRRRSWSTGRVRAEPGGLGPMGLRQQLRWMPWCCGRGRARCWSGGCR